MDTDTVIKTLLKSRGLTKKKDISEFFSPTHPSTVISPFDSTPAIQLISHHIEQGNHIAIYGDYDVDGICSTAILWETLYKNYQNVFPHIPHRREEGYGLSQLGIDNCLSKGAKLIITVDNGIVAHDQVNYCRSKGCDIIIIDHHELGESLPHANVVLHSLVTCAAGLTWFFCQDFARAVGDTSQPHTLELVSLAVVCDLVPLLGLNRSFVKYGLEDLNHTTRPGLLALFEVSGIKPTTNDQRLTTYHVGFVIGPRINAMGRLEHAIDSLRLLCTHDPHKAASLATVLHQTNKVRQDLTEDAVNHAISHLTIHPSSRLIVASDPSFDEGIIGLVAAKLVEKYYLPSLVISVGEKISKGSARSIAGFHITDHLRHYSDLLLGVGGHAMAAGFSLDTANLPKFTDAVSHPEISPELLVKKTRIDIEIPLSIVNFQLSTRLKQFAPFGLGNPTPIFHSTDVSVSNIKKMGATSQHLKFIASGLEAVWFNSNYPLEPGSYNLTYTIDENAWNGQIKIQLLIKEVSPSQIPE